MADDSVILLYQTTPHTLLPFPTHLTYGLSLATQEHGPDVYAFFIQFIPTALAFKPSSSSDSLQGGGRGIPWCVCKRLGNKRKYSSTNPSFVIQTFKLELLLDGYKARKSWLQSSKSDRILQPNNKPQKIHPKSHHSLQPNNIPQKFHPKSHHILKPNKQPKASSKSHHIL